MMTFSRSTVSLTLFFIFMLLSAIPSEMGGQGAIKELMALVFGAASIVVAIQGKRLGRSSDILWTYLVSFPLIYFMQLIALAAKYGLIKTVWPVNSPIPLVMAPVVVAAFVDLVNLIGRGHSVSGTYTSNSHITSNGSRNEVVDENKERT